MGTVSLLATLLLAAAAAGDGPAAVVHGKPLPRRAFHEALARRLLRGDGGEKALRHLLMDIAARREQERRGVVVSEEEVRRGVDEARRGVAEMMARSGQKVLPGQDPLEASLRERGATMEEFVEQARSILAIQKMAREDLGATGTVADAQVEIWLQDLLRKGGATTDPAALRPGEAARLGEVPVTWEEAGRHLARSARRAEKVGLALDLCFGVWIADRAAAAGASLSTEEIEAEIARVRREFARQPGIEGTGASFEEWLRDVKGLSLEEYRRDPSHLASLLARKLAAAGVAPEDVRKEWEENRVRYGETARVRSLVVHGEERATVFGSAARPMAEARRIVDRALEEIRGGKAFEIVARKYSEDFPPDGPRGQPVDLAAASRTTTAPQPVVDAVFAAKEGELLGPVKAADGWYLVLVEKRTPAPSYEQCAPRVKDDLVARVVSKWRLGLRDDREVKIAPDL